MELENSRETERRVFNLAMPVDTAAQRWNEKAVLYHYETKKSVSYKELSIMANRVGNALRRSGVELENRVAILMDDCPEWAYAFFGILKIGAIAIPLNTLLNERDYSFFLKDSRARAFFVGASYFEKIKDALPTLAHMKRVIVYDGGSLWKEGSLVVDWNAFIQGASDELKAEETLSTDTALFVYTSGSTGRPRAIMHSHGNLDKSLFSFKIMYGVGEGERQFHIAKLYFLTSLSGLGSTLQDGSSMVLLSGRPTPSTVLEVIARYKPAFLAGPPTIFSRLVDAARATPHLAGLSSVRYIFCTGEALSSELFHSFKEIFGKTLYNNWGAQEIAAAALAWRPGEEVPPDKIGSCGKTPGYGAQLKIVDEEGNEVPKGVPGEIMLKINSLFLGYWHEPREAALKLVQGWYKPGDSFLQDKDGYFWYLGRLDDMTKIGGRQIFPVEIEEAIARHPAVMENAVVSVKNEQGLMELQAFVVLKVSYSPSTELAEEIKNFVKVSLAPFKRPHRVVFVTELPKTATGKIQRFRLKDTGDR